MADRRARKVTAEGAKMMRWPGISVLDLSTRSFSDTSLYALVVSAVAAGCTAALASPATPAGASASSAKPSRAAPIDWVEEREGERAGNMSGSSKGLWITQAEHDVVVAVAARVAQIRQAGIG